MHNMHGTCLNQNFVGSYALTLQKLLLLVCMTNQPTDWYCVHKVPWLHIADLCMQQSAWYTLHVQLYKQYEASSNTTWSDMCEQYPKEQARLPCKEYGPLGAEQYIRIIVEQSAGLRAMSTPRKHAEETLVPTKN